MVRSFAFNVYFYTLTVLAALLGIVLVPIPTPVLLRGLLHRYAKAVVWGMRWVGGMKVELRGLKYLPKHGPALLAGKHQAEVDGILLAAEIPGIAFVAMQELFKLPVIGTILYRLQMIRVDTCGGGKERENLAQFARRAYDSGRHIAIYPEGNLMAPGERERYRSGIYYLSRDLEKRLLTRAQDSKQIVAERMAKAADEMSHWAEYDYVVINRDLDKAFADVRAILAAERLRRERQTGLSAFVRKLQSEL